MAATPVRIIAAIGRSGQIGLNGGLPWEKDILLQDMMKVDLEHFKKVTMGDVLLMGARTVNARKLWRLPGRHVIPWHGSDPKEFMLRSVIGARHLGRGSGATVWIAGGAYTYKAFADLCTAPPLITHMPYDGPADAYFPGGLL